MCKQQIQEIWIHFFNPVQLSWYPLPKVVHPGVQGVDRDSFLYPMYRELGYQNHSLQETYYLKLTEYKEHCIFYPNKSLSIDFYNSKIHKSLDPYTKKMKEKHWASVLLQNAEQVKPLPLLVALEDRQIIGFAGPLKVQENGRGYFAGIGILEEYRGQKLGKYLFNNLCQSLKDMGARYMTLFTGQNNVAKHIYLNTGFVVVKRFMTMKKTI